jgi:DNA-binding FadR family transcriptional regulator
MGLSLVSGSMSTSWKTVFEPVDASSTYEETVTRLGTAIRIGVLGAGTRLPPERELAEQLSISRSTLRQALATLTETGHLTAVRGRSGGTFVADHPPVSSGRPLPRERWRPMLDCRVAFETGTALRAAERAQEEDILALREALAALDEAADAGFAAYRRADARLHLLIAEAAHSPQLVRSVARVQGQLCDLFKEVGLSARGEEDREQHAAILDAIENGDPLGAVAAMRSHLEATEMFISFSVA